MLQSVLRAWGAELFCASMFWILTKFALTTGIESSRTVPSHWNRFQRHLYPRLARHNRLLKPRQPGSTTFFLLVRLFLSVITEAGTTGLLVSQNSSYASQHFMIVKRALRLIGALDVRDMQRNTLCESLKANLLHTQYSSRRELVFDQLDSKLVVESAEVEEAGQGITVQHAVLSEVSRWPGNPEETVSNIKGALTPDATLDEECTANGMGGYFCTQYLRCLDDEASGDARSHFYPWWLTEEYQDEMSDAEKDEMLKDLTETELQLIRRIHHDLQEVA